LSPTLFIGVVEVGIAPQRCAMVAAKEEQ